MIPMQWIYDFSNPVCRMHLRYAFTPSSNMWSVNIRGAKDVLQFLQIGYTHTFSVYIQQNLCPFYSAESNCTAALRLYHGFLCTRKVALDGVIGKARSAQPGN